MSDFEIEPNERAEKELKVVLAGDSCVGKTSLVRRYTSNDFSRQYFPTLGVDFFLKRLVLQRFKTITLKIWDIGGASQNGKMFDKYVYDSDIIILIYDVTNETSFFNIETWLRLVKNNLKIQEKQFMMALLGNKCDLEHQRIITTERHQKFANDLNLFGQIVSARTGECVNLSFQRIIAQYLGIKLTKSDLEENHYVIKAEVSTYSDLPPQSTRNLSNSRSLVCIIQ